MSILVGEHGYLSNLKGDEDVLLCSVTSSNNFLTFLFLDLCIRGSRSCIVTSVLRDSFCGETFSMLLFLHGGVEAQLSLSLRLRLLPLLGKKFKMDGVNFLFLEVEFPGVLSDLFLLFKEEGVK
uniref:Uncharacterized protein n=1 Tax=Lepeophtheirus salmonis TaxID=72036 RepID=A0A0K2UBW4_LEPSM